MRFCLLGLPVLLLLLLAGEPHSVSSTPGPLVLHGDFDCDSDVDGADSLLLAATLAGTGSVAPCALEDETDCDGDTDVDDLLLHLKQVADLRSDLPASCPAPGRLAAGSSAGAAAVYLADVITERRLVTSVEAVHDALALGGVALVDLDAVYLPASPPPAAAVASPHEALLLAIEARRRSHVYRVDLPELAQMLADFGWPFLPSPTPPEQLRNFFAVWVTGARQAPMDPQSFTPLFLAAMSSVQDPPVDLGSVASQPEDVRFSLLELELLSAAFDRASIHSPGPAAPQAQPASTQPCTEAKEHFLGPFGGQVAGIVQSEGTSEAMEHALEAVGAGEDTVDGFGKAMSAISILSRVWKLIALYGNLQVDVSVRDGSTVHKLSEGGPGPLLKQFRAVAGVSPQDYEEYQKKLGELGSKLNTAMRDCFSEFGIPTFADLGEIAREAEDWEVEWTLKTDRDHRGQNNSSWSPDYQSATGFVHLGHWRSEMERISPTSSETAFVIEVDAEEESDHPGALQLGYAYVCGEVETAEMPSLGTLVSAAKGGLDLADAIAELAAGLIQELATPKSCNSLSIEYHKPCGAVVASVSIEAITSFDELPCEWTGTAHGSIHGDTEDGYYDEVGEIDGTFTFGNRQPYGPGVAYEIISGSATWHNSGHVGNCSFSNSGTEEVVLGELIVSDDGSGQLMYVGLGWASSEDIEIGCGGGMAIIDANTFFDTCTKWPLTSLDLSGSCNKDGDGYNVHAEYEWHLTGESCPASAAVTPEGVCGGP